MHPHLFSANYIFKSFGINELIRGCSEFTIPLKDARARALFNVTLTITAHEQTQ